MMLFLATFQTMIHDVGLDIRAHHIFRGHINIKFACQHKLKSKNSRHAKISFIQSLPETDTSNTYSNRLVVNKAVHKICNSKMIFRTLSPPLSHKMCDI